VRKFFRSTPTIISMPFSTRRSSGLLTHWPLRLSQAALREPVAGGKPVNIVRQNLSGDLIDGGAELHYVTTTPMTSVTGPAASTSTTNVQLVLRGARSRSSHRLVG
jgi:hypothetical protein